VHFGAGRANHENDGAESAQGAQGAARRALFSCVEVAAADRADPRGALGSVRVSFTEPGTVMTMKKKNEGRSTNKKTCGWAIAALCVLGSGACGDKSQSEAKAAAQMAGQSARSGAEAAGEATKEAAEKTKAAAERVQEEAREGMKEAKEKSADALENAAEKIRED